MGSLKLRTGLEKWVTEDENIKGKTKKFFANNTSSSSTLSSVTKPSTATSPKLNFSPALLGLKAFAYGGIIASIIVGSIGLFTYKVIIPYTNERDRKRYHEGYYEQLNKKYEKEEEKSTIEINHLLSSISSSSSTTSSLSSTNRNDKQSLR